ncbi:MAG: putative 2-ketoarginine decarboxylase AruI [Alphaproteobacteria bacterium]|nr:MAG: putative 2-ketoarginine decarboxylase AruI [Alphaproteobacteria bacterium]
MTANRTCGEAAIDLLEAYGVDTVFGIPGVHTLDLYRGLAGSKLRHIAVRHEQGAGFMADGYARVSGRPGVCVLITGPGVTNAATPIGQAFSDSVPMLVVSSVNATEDLGRGRGRLHEITDQRAVMAPLTAFSRTIHDPAELPKAMADAYQVFDAARPRPVHIELPLDVLQAPARFNGKQAGAKRRPQPDAKSLDAAAQLLQSARRPVVIAGGGTVDCGAALAAFVEKLGAALFLTVAAKGVVRDDHPRCAGATLQLQPSRDLLQSADVVVAVGTELAETDSWVDRLPIEGKLIRIDIDAPTLTRDYEPAVALLADAESTLVALTDRLASRRGDGVPPSEIAELRRRHQADLSPLQRKHAMVLDAVREALPEDAVLATDMTQIAYTGCYYYRSQAPRSWLHPVGYGTLGYALPAAIGAKLAAPERATAAIAGDAGFLFTVQELATAVELGLPIAILLWNNDALQQIAEGMTERGIPEVGVRLRNPDFQALAKAFGCRAVRPDSLAALGDAIRTAVAADGPTLIEVREDSPYLG